jgi:hypothetical protein
MKRFQRLTVRGMLGFLASFVITTTVLATTGAGVWPGCAESGPQGNCQWKYGPDSGCTSTSTQSQCIGDCMDCCRGNCAFAGSDAVSACDACCSAYNGGSTTGPAHCSAL